MRSPIYFSQKNATKRILENGTNSDEVGNEKKKLKPPSKRKLLQQKHREQGKGLFPKSTYCLDENPFFLILSNAYQISLYLTHNFYPSPLKSSETVVFLMISGEIEVN